MPLNKLNINRNQEFQLVKNNYKVIHRMHRKTNKCCPGKLEQEF